MDLRGFTGERYERTRKPRKCPVCGSNRIADIWYGMQAYSEELDKGMKEGRIVLGGCCISDDDPKWQCADCDIRIYKKGCSDGSD